MQASDAASYCAACFACEGRIRERPCRSAASWEAKSSDDIYSRSCRQGLKNGNEGEGYPRDATAWKSGRGKRPEVSGLPEIWRRWRNSIQSLAQAGMMSDGEDQSSWILVPWEVQPGNGSPRQTGAERKQLKARWPVLPHR